MSLVMVNRLNGVLVIAAVLGVGGSVTGQDPSPADRAALANAEVLGIEATVLDIVGVSLGVSGVLKDLGAKVTPEEIRIELSADVLFDFDKSDLKPDATGSLAKVADVINAYPAAPLLIEGHTDAKGTHPYNVTLSETRAAAVKSWLVQHAGVDPARIKTSGAAETKPVAPNTLPNGADNPDGRRKNRRVEITLHTR